MGQFDFTTGVTPIKLDDHSARHEDGGADEISLTGLSGDPADTINESLLTTQNDIIVRGASIAERLNITEQTLAGRLTGGNVSAVALGIADNNVAQIDGTTNSPANLDYAKFTASGLEGKSYQELVNDISGVIKATDVEVSELSTATYDDVQGYINFFGDRTLLSGGGITDNSNGTATVAAGTAWAKATDSDTAVGKFFDFSADNSVSLTDLLTNYVYLDYNAGTPQIVVSTSIATHLLKQDHIHIATIFRNGTTLHFHEEDAIGIGRVNIVDSRLLEMHDADRASGLITTDATSLALNVSAGVIYEGLNRHTTAAQIPASWSTWYYDYNATKWDEVTGQSTLDNANYNLTTSGDGLASLTSNRYAVHWVYVDIDGANLHIVYGQGDYTINQAEEAGVPASLPDVAVHYGVLIAKVIVQEGQTSLEILYPWTTTIHSSKSTDHGNLAGLSDVVDHAYALLHNGTRALSGAWDMGSQNLTNVNIDSGTIDGVTITSPAINGTITTTGLTIPAFALGGKLTAGANEIEGSVFDINGGDINGVTVTGMEFNGAGTSVADDIYFGIGTGYDFGYRYETADEDAKMLHHIMYTAGDASNVAVMAIGDISLDGIDIGTTLGWDFAGKLDPLYIWIDADVDSYVGFGFNGDDDAQILIGGSAVLTLPAFTLGGKLTAGAVEIEGSAFDINGGDMTGVTISGALTWSAAQDLNNQALTNVNIDGGDIAAVTFSGDNTWSVAQTGVTLTAPTLNGTTTLGATPIFAVGSGYMSVTTTASDRGIDFIGSNATHGARLKFIHEHTTPDVGNNIGTMYWQGYDGAGTPAAFTYGAITVNYTNVINSNESAKYVFYLADAGSAYNIAAELSGAGVLSLDVGVDADEYYKVAGTQVVAAQGAAVADATGAGDVVAQLNALLARCRAHGLIAT